MGPLQRKDGGAMARLELQAVVARMRQLCDLRRQVHGVNYVNRLVLQICLYGHQALFQGIKKGYKLPLFDFVRRPLKRVADSYRKHPGVEADVGRTLDTEGVGGYSGFHTRRCKSG